MSIKIAIIGAGSVGFTRGMVRDILCVPELQGAKFAFMDIDRRNLDMVYQLCKRDIESAGLAATVLATLNQREAIKDADYVLSFVRVGGLEGFETDVDIPLKYGVDQCVGDTLGAGRHYVWPADDPVVLGICKDIREVGAPGCMFLNYSNPNAMNTWACNQYGGVKTIGLCHGVWAAGGRYPRFWAFRRTSWISSARGSIIRPGISASSTKAWS